LLLKLFGAAFTTKKVRLPPDLFPYGILPRNKNPTNRILYHVIALDLVFCTPEPSASLLPLYNSHAKEVIKQKQESCDQ
jgi:hypothetical protein